MDSEADEVREDEGRAVVAEGADLSDGVEDPVVVIPPPVYRQQERPRHHHQDTGEVT